MIVFRFRQFSSSRWITIGCSLRTLIAACALGIRRLHQLTVDDPKVGTYDLGGFGKLTSPMLRFNVVAAIYSRPTEALSLAVLEEDRAVRNLKVYEAHLQHEIDWTMGVDAASWNDLVWDGVCRSFSCSGSILMLQSRFQRQRVNDPFEALAAAAPESFNRRLRLRWPHNGWHESGCAADGPRETIAEGRRQSCLGASRADGL